MSKRAQLSLMIAALSGITDVSHSQSNGRPLTIKDYYRVLDVGTPQMSPDGRYVSFTVARRIEATNSDSSVVWVVNANGNAPARRVSATGMHATNPQWSRDGRLRFVGSGRVWYAGPVNWSSVADSGSAGGGGRGGRAGGGGESRLASPDGRWSAVVRAVPPPPLAPAARTDF